MTSTPVRSSYPVPVSELIPKARELAAELGSVPSRNRLMSEYRIGADKARRILDALGTTEQEMSRAVQPEPRLHAVPDRAEGDDTADTAELPEVAPARTAGASSQVTPHVDPGATPVALRVRAGRRVRSWPVLLLALPAFVAVWSGWVGLGGLTGFGVVHPLPGIADGFAINSAITLPIGVETYAAFALRAWLSGRVPVSARRFAKWSAIGALILGALGQVAYHLLVANGVTQAPWQITTVVACLPVAVLGMGAALAHLLHAYPDENGAA